MEMAVVSDIDCWLVQTRHVCWEDFLLQANNQVLYDNYYSTVKTEAAACQVKE
jgi:hypothetical protein